MKPLYPFQFRLDGMTQSYLWGGDALKSLVPSYDTAQPLAEIWVVSDRPEDNCVSVVANGELAGMNLHQLIEQHGSELLGNAKLLNGKFPLLLKLLDAKEPLSVQVHPPASVAATLKGEPKTEAWLLLDGTAAGASVIAGLTAPRTRKEFESALTTNTLEPLLNTLPVKAGDCMFVPSGRLHAIGTGCLILEIQENSNTTYRVYDWQRVDPITNQARPLHIDQALQSIDLHDVRPMLTNPVSTDNPACQQVVTCPQFSLERWVVNDANTHHPSNSFELITCLNGNLQLESDKTNLPLVALTTILIPASIASYAVQGAGSYSRVFVPSTV